jgi:creatinine amidohydrolase
MVMKMAMETRWLHTTSENLPKLCEESKGVCVIPLGCVEKHGLQLPLGADILQVSGIAYEASKLETFTVFPDFTFGDVPMGGPNAPAGSITLPPELQLELLMTLCDQAARWGYKKIVLYNGHGGNGPLIALAMREWCQKKRNYVLASVDVGLPALKTMGEYLEKNGTGSIPELTVEDEEYLVKCYKEKIKGGHACLGEAANMMGLYPEDVHLDRLGIESGLSTNETKHLRDAGVHIMSDGWDIDYPNSFSGEDFECNERIGKASVRFNAEKLASQIRLIKEDTNIEKWLIEEYQKGWEE